MKQQKQKESLHGWDDGKIYFYDESGKENCVSDQPELMENLMKICREFFKKERGRQ
jgi:hypothetical protein